MCEERSALLPTKTRQLNPPAACDACTHAYYLDELEKLELATVQGVEVMRCVDPVTCRRRGELIGVWLTR